MTNGEIGLICTVIGGIGGGLFVGCSTTATTLIATTAAGTAAGSSEADFYRNGTKVCEITTDVPSGTTERTGFGQSIYPEAATGTGARSIEIDQTRVALDMTSARSP